MKSWSRIAASDWGYLPESGGVYAVFLDSRLIYIGQTGCLRQRFQSHSRNGYGALLLGRAGTVSIRFSLCDGDAERLWRESRLISRLDPPANGRDKWTATTRDEDYDPDVVQGEFAYPPLIEYTPPKVARGLLRAKYLPDHYKRMLAPRYEYA